MNGNLATASFEKSNFVIAPNPTYGFVKINGKNIQKVTVKDLQGKILFTQNYPVSDAIDLDLSLFQNGVYLATFSDKEGNNASLKILKY